MQCATQEDRVYDDLKTLILQGGLPQGEFLSQRMLASRVKSAVITVRGALRRLESDGLIESVPRWGVRIPPETEATVRDRYFLRAVLEVAAVRRIVADCPEALAQELRQRALDCDRVNTEAPEDEALFAERHLAFHLCIARLSGSPLLEQTLARLNLRSLMLLNAKRGWGRGKDRSPTHHQDLAEAILSEDECRAVAAIQEHILRGLQYEMEVIRDEQTVHDPR